jgi:hypothetical protein
VCVGHLLDPLHLSEPSTIATFTVPIGQLPCTLHCVFAPQSEISKSLKACSTKVLELRDDMKDYTESAERIREDIKTLRNR